MAFFILFLPSFLYYLIKYPIKKIEGMGNISDKLWSFVASNIITPVYTRTI
ncbi:hypothetical protein HMPREF0083_05858 [Aneurinibacillus aneurinilyticus ATCC 12856]|uniref:Uncharacterized protein n=1 Tax=Aneurinibacillus aneurinilyticus ATCC 12856 TaxID=649747 RepID=U1WQQ2_ANEAE|nr:hypothetical protein HMPREF0083_05858 [Aneurinibacillus aneurinilyticus ATCC 12856]